MLRHAGSASKKWLEERARQGVMLVALDFDGTLAPIVPTPDAAQIPPHTRSAVARLAGRRDTRVAVLSGRALADIEARVGVGGVFYAGNHGLEIRGPGLERISEEAQAALPSIRECLERLGQVLGDEEGVLLEDKGLTLSVHYRLVGSQERSAAVVEAVARACEGVPGVRLTYGKRVVEVRPAVKWDKGRAILFLMDSLIRQTDPVLFIGDDRTDEDAFRALSGLGDGIVVADPVPADTAASYYLKSTEEVAAFLETLAGNDVR